MSPESPTGLAARAPIVARNIAAGLAAQVWTIVLGLVTVPVLVHSLGAAAYGLLGIALAVIGIGSMFDLGVGRSLAKYVAEEGGDATRYIASGFGLALLIGLALWVLLLPAVPALIRAFVHGSVAQLQSYRLRWAGDLTILGLPAVILRLVFEGSLIGYQRIDLTSLTRVVTNTLKALATILVALVWHSLWGVIAATVLVSYATVAILFWCCHRESGGEWIAPKLAAGYVRKIAHLGGLATVCLIFGYIFLYVDRGLILYFLALPALGYYTGAFDLAIRETAITNNLSQSFLPVFSAHAADAASLATAYFQASRLNAAAATGPALLIAAFAPSILSLWIGPVFAGAAAATLRILALGVLTICYANVAYTLIFAAMAKPQVYVWFYLVGIATHIGVSLMMISWLGIAGVALGFLAGYAAVWLIALAYIAVVSRPDPLAPLLRAYLPSFAVGLVCAGIGGFLQRGLAWPPLPAVGLMVGLVVTNYVVLAMIGFNQGERRAGWKLVRGLIGSAI